MITLNKNIVIRFSIYSSFTLMYIELLGSVENRSRDGRRCELRSTENAKKIASL